MSVGDLAVRPKMSYPSVSNYSSSGCPDTLNPFANALFCKRFTWEGTHPPLAVPKSKQVGGVGRSKVLDWLGSLSRDQLVSASLIDNQQFIEQFIQSIPIHRGRLLHLPSSRSISLGYSTEIATPFDLIAMLKVTLTSQWVMHINGTNLTGKQLAQWLNAVSRNKVFDLPQRSLDRKKAEQNILWFNSATFHTIEQWLANQIEKSIVQYYHHSSERFRRIRTLRNHMQDMVASKHLISSLELSIDQVWNLTSSERLKLTQSFRIYEESMSDQIEVQILNIECEKKKKRKRRNKKPQHDKTSLEKMAEQKNIPSNQEKSGQIDTTDTLKIELTEDQQILLPLLPKNNNIEDQVSLEEVDMSQTIQLTWDPVHTEIVTKSMNATSITFDLQGSSPKDKQHQEYFDQHQLDSISEQNIKLERKGSHHHLGSNKFIEESHYEQDNNDTQSITRSNGEVSDLKTRRKKKRKGQKMQNKITEQFKSTMVSLILNKQLNNMLDNLSTQSNSSYESKVIAFERVRYFVKSLCPYGQALLFGSNAVGLSLPTSDIDIMLIDMNCQSKEDICECLGQIAIYINAMGWVTSCSTYFGAKVPLVKLEIDPSISYFTPKCKIDYYNPVDQYNPCYLDMKDSSKGVPVKIDITISTEDSRVSGSTELMRNWLDENTSLQRVLLALKYTLSVRGYSENFKGGIGSYCLFVMVAAYFKQFGETRQNKDCQILLDILKFYGEDFQNQLKVVTLSKGKETSAQNQGTRCFISNEQASQRYGLPTELMYTNLLKIIDPLYDKLMSSSCYQFNCIKAEWRYIRSQILKVEELVENEIDSCFTGSSEMSKVMSSKKSLDKWANKLMARMDFSLAKIIGRST